MRRARERCNWRVYVVEHERVGRDLAWSSRHVIALEPNREFENVFTGPDDLMNALEYAASQLRKANSEH